MCVGGLTAVNLQINIVRLAKWRQSILLHTSQHTHLTSQSNAPHTSKKVTHLNPSTRIWTYTSHPKVTPYWAPSLVVLHVCCIVVLVSKVLTSEWCAVKNTIHKKNISGRCLIHSSPSHQHLLAIGAGMKYFAVLSSHEGYRVESQLECTEQLWSTSKWPVHQLKIVCFFSQS